MKLCSRPQRKTLRNGEKHDDQDQQAISEERMLCENAREQDTLRRVIGTRCGRRRRGLCVELPVYVTGVRDGDVI